MNIYIEMLLVAAITIYIVDVSGFTESWRHLLERMLHITKMRDLPPFDCGKCMTWWVCLIYPMISREISLETIAFATLLSLLSVPIGGVMIFIREWIIWITNKLMP